MTHTCPNCGFPHLKPGEKVYVVEARKANGELDVRGKQPPFLFATSEQLFDIFFQAHKDKPSASWAEIRAWYNDQGWYFREKTW